MVKRTEEIKKPSSMPIVLLGAAWAAGCILFPMIRISDYLIVAGISLIVFAVSRKMIPDEVHTVEIKLSPLEQMRAEQLDKAQHVLHELVEASEKIDDEELMDDLKRVRTVCTEIVRKMEKDDNVNDQSRKLVDHYLPMLVNLLKNYDELEENPIQTENVTQSRKNIKKTVALCADAFEKQWNDLFEADSMTISAESDVLESLLSAQGFGKTSDKEEN